jgi:hypothetical protein
LNLLIFDLHYLLSLTEEGRVRKVNRFFVRKVELVNRGTDGVGKAITFKN